MQEGDEIDLFWDAIGEPNHERKYYSWLNRKYKLCICLLSFLAERKISSRTLYLFVFRLICQ